MTMRQSQLQNDVLSIDDERERKRESILLVHHVRNALQDVRGKQNVYRLCKLCCREADEKLYCKVWHIVNN